MSNLINEKPAQNMHEMGQADPSLTEEEVKLTHQFSEQWNAIGETPVCWSDAVRFLMARKFEVHRALELYKKHEAVRVSEQLSNISALDPKVRQELLTEKFTVLEKRAACGATIALFTARLHTPDSTGQRCVLQALVLQLDAAMKSLHAQRNGLIFVYDMTHSKYCHFEIDLSKKILTLLKGAYPARLKKVLIVTAPLWFKAPFKILRIFVKEKLRERVHTVGVKDLPDHIPSFALPKHLGGSLEVNHSNWLRIALSNDPELSPKQIDSFFVDVDCCNLLNMSVHSDQSGCELSSESTTTSPSSQSLTLHGVTTDATTDSLTVDEKGEHNGNCKRTEESTTRKRRSPVNADETASEHATYRRRIDDESPSGVEGMTIAELKEHVEAKGRHGLVDEYSIIRSTAVEGTFYNSRLKSNTQKNRYSDVMCLDESRVMLSDPNSDYINGNFVDGYNHKRAFISTQGPLDRTFSDFWRMVWEQNCVSIVMTTRLTERGRSKCGCYWPREEQTEHKHADFLVANEKIATHENHIESSLVLQHVPSGQSRHIMHVQYVSWPDYGVPRCSADFLRFMFRVRELQHLAVQAMSPSWEDHPDGPPIVVHCSAGIGRTGTFICMDTLVRSLMDCGLVDVHGTVQRIRSQRAFSIQMPEQYVFVHTAMLEYAQSIGMLESGVITLTDSSESD